MIDHYRTLGVAATADEAVIRAVYVALMKRFHPDRNASPETLRQAQAINEAYAVLSDPIRRAAYDDERAGMQPWDRGAMLPTQRGGAWGTGVVTAMLTLAAVGGLYAYWPRLTERETRTAASSPLASTPARCASLADPERIRMALIARLDQVGALDQAAAGALTAARFDLGPATDARDLASPGEVACLATLAITLPASFRTASGQGTILSELQYSVSRTDPALGVEVQPDGRLVAALSAIRHQPRVAVTNPMLEEEVRIPEQPAMLPKPVVPERRTEPAIVRKSESTRVVQKVAERAAPRPDPPAASRRTGGGLGGVDRQTMNFYVQSLRHADSAKRGRLASSHAAFASRLAACGSDACRRDAYLSLNVQISRIMMGQ